MSEKTRPGVPTSAPPPVPADARRDSTPIPLVKRTNPGATPPPPPLPATPTQRPAVGGDPASGSLIGGSTQQRLDLASAALKLRGEQVSARVVYFNPEQQTNAELDAITQQVINDLRAIQDVRQSQRPETTVSSADYEIDLIAVLRKSLEQVLDPRRGNFLKLKLELLSRRFTTLFFEFALGHNARPEELAARLVTTAEQALYTAVLHNQQRLRDDLRALHYEREELYDTALERLGRWERDLQSSYLSQRAPELGRLLPIVIEVFTEFFHDGFRSNLGEFCWAVVREGKVARAGDPIHGMPRIGPRAFPSFREAFEKHFLENLVLNVQDPLVARLNATSSALRPETLAFVADPRVFSTACGVMCDAFYDHLHSEGLLDLPQQWRQAAREG
ncbi:MAG: hypothetical protein Q8S73_34115 [Deltaproteobacteria bacterium]|nr:hypothetical protein [Myxococcales bacterium]MDP3219184.1 hypothetical protein [Deltaproteobacteria bacterium]